MSDRLHVRPPQESFSPTLEITEGCTHGKCRFCSLYTGADFKPVDMVRIEEGIKSIASKATALTRRIYLTGGNPFALPVNRLTEIFDRIERRIPTIRNYGGFCSVTDIKRKTDDELALLASRGVNDITIGAESGHNPTLEFMAKGHTAEDIMEQGQRLHEAGIDFTFFYLAGLAGAGKGQENALASAKAFSAAGPGRILVVTLTPTRDWRLRENILNGTWVPSEEVEVAREIQTFAANLTCKTRFNASHDSNIIRFEGVLPNDQGKMVELLDHQIPKMNPVAARRLRELLHKAPFYPVEEATKD